jgi:DDE superfamily endonuclease/Transposase DDE domain
MAKYRCPQEWSDWGEWLAAGLHGENRWRLPVLLMGVLFATGRRTVAAWLRAAGVGDDWRPYYYFISAVGRKAESLAARLLRLVLARLPTGPRLLFALDDTPTQRYGPHVEGAGIHHNPTPGPADSKYVYGHIWVTLALILRHKLWGTIGLPLLAKLYIRLKDIGKLPRDYGWPFQTKLQQAVDMIRWAANMAAEAGKRLWIVADGFYAKRPVFKIARALGVVLISRLRKDAALWTLPPPLKKGQRRGRGKPRKYGDKRISLAKRAGQSRGWFGVECVQYGERVRKKVKTFLATYRPAYGVIRVVIVQEPTGCQFFFSIDSEISVEQILEVFADRAAIEQDFHDLKEVWGAGQQQVRHLWANIGAWHLNLWMHTLVELWAWHQRASQICDRRASPWDDPTRRPSHADRRKALRRWMLREEYSAAARRWQLPRKIRALVQTLFNLAA